MKNTKIHKLVGVALLIAVMVVLQFIGTIFPIKIGPVSISLVLIPIVIGAAVYGPGAGAILGAAFGVIANVFCANGLDGGGHMVFQASPILCILVVMLKGICCGLVAGLVYKLFSRWNAYVAMLLAAIVCPIVNTGIFILGCLTFFMDTIRGWGEAAGFDNAFVFILLGLIGINFIIELLINVMLSPVVIRLLDIREKK